VVSLTAARKERERAAREELMIDHATRLLLKDGYQNLNLDVLADAIEYSKGTIYLHFSTKEDLVLAVATRILKERADLFERAARFKGRTRERVRAIGFTCAYFAQQHPDYFNVEMMLKSASFWEKASAERRQTHGAHGARCFQSLNNIVLDAIRCGDLPSDVQQPEAVSLSLIAMTMGSHCVSVEPELLKIAAVEDAVKLLRKNQDIVCDGWGWKPLFKNFDYAATDKRIRKEIFPEVELVRG